MSDQEVPTEALPNSEEFAGAPRWVKVFGAIAIVVIALFVILLIAGGGGHGPGRHLPANDPPAGSTTSPGDAEPGGSADHEPAGGHRS